MNYERLNYELRLIKFRVHNSLIRKWVKEIDAFLLLTRWLWVTLWVFTGSPHYR